jgi:hypothetical protein
MYIAVYTTITDGHACLDLVPMSVQNQLSPEVHTHYEETEVPLPRFLSHKVRGCVADVHLKIGPTVAWTNPYNEHREKRQRERWEFQVDNAGARSLRDESYTAGRAFWYK